MFKTDGVRSVALGHNGNLVNTRELAAARSAARARHAPTRDLVTAMIAAETPDTQGLEDAAMRVLPHAPGRVLLRVHGRAERLRGA